jgi:hypothetical protein
VSVASPAWPLHESSFKKGVRFSVQTFSEGSEACRSSCGVKGGVDQDKGKATVGDKVRLESSDPREAQKSRESAF